MICIGRRIGLTLLSFIIVAFGQPGWIPGLGPVAAVCGYALFWASIMPISSRRERFWSATLWFATVQMVQLSWMTSYEYQGLYILFAYQFFCFAMGAQFGFLSLLLPTTQEEIRPLRMLVMASTWTLFEWSRLFFLCGFTWNMSGIALTSFAPSMQLASVAGIFGLTFWVILVNVSALKNFKLCAGLALLPYLFGFAHMAYHDKSSSGKEYSVALVQTGLLPGEKIPLKGYLNQFVPPADQWRRILQYLGAEGKQSFDLIVMPEVAVPFGSDLTFYSHEMVVNILREELGDRVLQTLPSLQSSLAQKKLINGKEVWFVSNAYWAHAIANFFKAEVVAGLEGEDRHAKKYYNAGFHFVPHRLDTRRCDKRVLFPIAEYLPYDWCRPLAANYGVTEFYTQGTEAKVFDFSIPLHVSICYEETFADLVREGRQKGAALLVNLTNDGWYPASKLPEQHYCHGRLRAIENGAHLVRSCNTGVTAVIDPFGRTLARLGEKDEDFEKVGGVLAASFVPNTHWTLYTQVGDGLIIGLSLMILGIFYHSRKESQG